VNNEDFLQMCGKFWDINGNRVEAPGPQAAVVIVAGPWEHMPVGAMQTQCRVCERLLGVDARSQTMLNEPGRVVCVLCRNCWTAFGHWRQGDTAAMLRAIEGRE
jgi:hypothetical protein